MNYHRIESHDEVDQVLSNAKVPNYKKMYEELMIQHEQLLKSLKRDDDDDNNDDDDGIIEYSSSCQNHKALNQIMEKENENMETHVLLCEYDAMERAKATSTDLTNDLDDHDDTGSSHKHNSDDRRALSALHSTSLNDCDGNNNTDSIDIDVSMDKDEDKKSLHNGYNVVSVSDDHCDYIEQLDDIEILTIKDRATWLVMLLLFQSFSGIILGGNADLLSRHPSIVYFLTMLVGAGGNAGNQSAVQMIRAMAVGKIDQSTQWKYVIMETKTGLILSLVLALFGCMRASFFKTPLPETVAITITLSVIVFVSILCGCILPLILKKCGIDPVHSSTTIQVIMDILGVLLTVTVSGIILEGATAELLFGD